MIDLTYIRGFYPPQIANNAYFQKHLLFEPRKSEQILHFLEILGIA